MKTTFILINTGDESPALISLQISYFEKSGEQAQVASKEFTFSITTNQESVQELDFGDSIVGENEAFVIIKKINGSIITQQSFMPEKLDGQRVEIKFTLNKEVQLETAEAPAELSKPSFVYGRLLDKKGLRKMEDIQIIITAKKDTAGDFEPITSVKTEAQGYFYIEYPLGSFIQAAALVGMELVQNPIPIRLEEKAVDQEQTELVFPRRVILVAEIRDDGEPKKEDEDNCGCSSLKFDEKRVLEEFSYYSLVRTSEPAIKGFILEDEEELTLEDVLKNLPFTIFELVEPIKAFPFIVRESPIKTAVLTTGTAPGAPRARAAARDDDDFVEKIRSIKIQKKVLKTFLNDEKAITKDNIGKLFAYNEAARFQQTIDTKPSKPQPLGRVALDENNAIDWDEEPTIYQAVEVAHGHLLQFKSEWIDDGYSLGDLLYSLPLAPGQKKQIVVFDWERRESASNIQSIDYEESLYNSLIHDRTIFEIAKGTISESLRGSSSATTGGASGGIGGFLGGFLFGVSGGFGTSNSKSSQDSLRQVSSSDQQKLNDRVVQSANAVRSMRSTVIQTVAQGERFEVSAETVANYNHCHAMTIQYYEVLWHFKIRQRFIEARECLFIPLLMSQFDLKKALRWREALQPALLDKRLDTAFDAGDRVAHEWKDSDFPSGTFASENILSATGVLRIKFVLRRPMDKIEEVEDKSRPVVTINGVVYPYTKKVAKMIPENWEGLKKFLGSLTPEQFYEEYLAEAKDKDAVFHRELGEKIARKFIELLAFHVIDENNHLIGTIPIDASLTSRYHRDGVLKVTLRLAGATSFRRDKFHNLQIKPKPGTDALSSGLPDGSFLTVESGRMRYRTKHFEGFLFNYQYLGDDLTATDGVTIYAGPSNEELKDPRKEDVVLVNRLIAHLNDNLEYYHKAIWLSLTLERRFMLLDGIILNEKGEGRSVASLVENELIGIVGNSLVFPVAPGLNLNPDFGLKESLTDFYMVAASDPISVSVPTKGVFAESVMGKCNSCEEKDESRFWRWEESPIPDSPTAILPIDTATRRAEPGNLQPAALPNPMVNIQNAPNAPDPTGLSGLLQLLGKSDVFRDITGLTENQKNALAALQSTLETAKAFGQEASKLEIQKAMERKLDTALNKIKNSGLPADKQADLTEKAINAYLGAGPKQEEKPKTDQQKAEGAKAKTSVIKDAVDTGVISPKVGEHLAASSLQHALFGAAEEVTPGTIEAQDLLSNPSVADKDLEFENSIFKLAAKQPGAQAGAGSSSAAPAQLNVTFIAVNKVLETDPVNGVSILLHLPGFPPMVTNHTGNRVIVDMAGVADGDFDIDVIPRDGLSVALPITQIGDPATNPPNRLWLRYGTTITKTGNTFTSSDPRVSIQNLNITVRLQPLWMAIAANTGRGTHVPSVIIVHHTDDENRAPAYDANFHSKIDRSIRAWMGNGFAPHYVIDRDGSVVKLGHESRQAYHADPAKWDGQRFVNQFSVGIEIVHTNNVRPNDGPPTYTEDYTQEQYTALIELLNDLTQALNIPAYSIVGHSDVATSGVNHMVGRKSGDPGIKFDWKLLEAEGLGLQQEISVIDFNNVYGGFFTAHPGGRIRAGAPGVTPAIVTELKDDLTRIGYSVTNNDSYDQSVERAMMVFCEHFLALDHQDSVNVDAAGVIKRVVEFLADVKP